MRSGPVFNVFFFKEKITDGSGESDEELGEERVDFRGWGLVEEDEMVQASVCTHLLQHRGKEVKHCSL